MLEIIENLDTSTIILIAYILLNTIMQIVNMVLGRSDKAIINEDKKNKAIEKLNQKLNKKQEKLRNALLENNEKLKGVKKEIEQRTNNNGASGNKTENI